MNYTKEMQEAGSPLKAGMLAIYEGLHIKIIGFMSNGAAVFEYVETGSLNYMLNESKNQNIKPVDTRTDTEKAVDDLKGIYTKWLLQPGGSYSKLIVEQIKEGKITDVKWVGND